MYTCSSLTFPTGARLSRTEVYKLYSTWTRREWRAQGRALSSREARAACAERFASVTPVPLSHCALNRIGGTFMNQKRFASHALRELVSSLKLPLLQGKDMRALLCHIPWHLAASCAAEDASSPSECFDLANSKLWLTELDWSDEAAQLREAAVSNPTAYTVELAYKLLRRLRLVDQQVQFRCWLLRNYSYVCHVVSTCRSLSLTMVYWSARNYKSSPLQETISRVSRCTISRQI